MTSTSKKKKQSAHHIVVDFQFSQPYGNMFTLPIKPYSIRSIEDLNSVKFIHTEIDFSPRRIDVPSSLMTAKRKRHEMHSDFALNVAQTELRIEEKRYIKALIHIEGILTDALTTYDDDGKPLLEQNSPAIRDIAKVQEKYRDRIRTEIYERTRQCTEIMELSEDAPEHVFFLLNNLFFGGNAFGTFPIFIKSKNHERCTRFLELALSIIGREAVLGIFEPPYPDTLKELYSKGTLLHQMNRVLSNIVAIFADFDKLKRKENIWMKVDDMHRRYGSTSYSEFERSVGGGNIKFVFIGKHSFEKGNSKYHLLNLE